MDPSTTTPHRPRDEDVAALIGLLAVLEGDVWGQSDLDGAMPRWAVRIARRLSDDGLLGADPTSADLQAALGGLNDRLRHVRGEYD